MSRESYEYYLQLLKVSPDASDEIIRTAIVRELWLWTNPLKRLADIQTHSIRNPGFDSYLVMKWQPGSLSASTCDVNSVTRRHGRWTVLIGIQIFIVFEKSTIRLCGCRTLGEAHTSRGLASTILV